MDSGLVVVLIVVVLAIAAGVSWAQRSRGPARRETPANVGTGLRAPGAETADAPTDQGAMLVPLPTARNEALVLGSSKQLETLQTAGLIKELDGPQVGPLPGALRGALAAGGGEATRRAQAGIDAGRIVALSEETMKHLKRGAAARDKVGNTLGIVRGKKGFTHVMRLDKAGAKAVMASNAATLAMTAAVSQHLAHIEQQLGEIRETLDEMRGDAQIEKLSDAISTNRRLERIIRNVERRGYMTPSDRNDLSSLGLNVDQNVTEAEMKVVQLLQGTNTDLSRNDRLEQLRKLIGTQRLEFWLALLVETQLAYTRWDLLELYWEQSQEPEALGSKAEEVRRSIAERQQRMKQLGEALRQLSDPERRRWLDPFQQLSRIRLGKADAQLEKILAEHGEVFAGPEHDPFAVVEGRASEVLLLNPGTGEPSKAPATAARNSAP